MSTPVLLTEGEAAERLRCSTEKIKRLRLSGRLAYHRGRPVLIDEADLQTYLDTIRRPAMTAKPLQAKEPVRSSAEEASARARRVWLARHLARR